jgi:hypothetical protein
VPAARHEPKADPPLAESSPDEALPVEEPAAPTARSLGPARILRVTRDDIRPNSDVVEVEFPSPTANALFVAFGSASPHLSLWIDGAPHPLRDGRFSVRGPCQDKSNPAAFRVTVELPESVRLPAGEHSLRLAGTVPVLVGIDPQKRSVPWPEKPETWTLEAGGLTLSEPRVKTSDAGRRVVFDAYGSSWSVTAVELLDRDGRPIASRDRGAAGTSISGHLMGNWRVDLLADTPIASIRVSHWKTIEVWDVSLDVTGRVER